jgi:hypothetical protein
MSNGGATSEQYQVTSTWAQVECSMLKGINNKKISIGCNSNSGWQVDLCGTSGNDGAGT